MSMEHIFIIPIVILVAVVSTESLSECSQSRHGIELASSLEGEGRTAACPGETVVYTCTVPTTGVLQWAVESFNTFASEPIILSMQYDPVGTVEEAKGGLITANVTGVVPEMVYWGEITSTLTLLPHEGFHNKTVWCGDGASAEAESPYFVHNYGVAPSAPLSPAYSIISRDTASFSVLVEWTRPQSDGGLGISNYTTTLRAPHSLLSYVGTRNKFHVTLLYNRMYTLQLTAKNCGGQGPPVNMSQIFSVSCGVPDLLSTNASDQDSTAVSTHEGSQLIFLCADQEKIMLNCSKNGSWTPDPSEQCSNIKQLFGDGAHCKAPILPPHSHIDDERSVLGSVVVYQCDEEYEPAELMVSRCSSSGEWEPNITTTLQCTKQVDCGAPKGPMGGSLHYTGTGRGSKALVECGEGLALQGENASHVAVCSANGSWLPDLSSQRCTEVVTTVRDSIRPKESESGVYFYPITGGVVLLVSLPLGILLGCFCSRVCCFQKKEVSPTSQLIPKYEEVELKTQLGPVAMNMTENVAYAMPKIQQN